MKNVEKKLLLYAKNHFNVLLEGLHGVGKTSIIKSIFDQLGWNYITLNAATMDPYLDLIGAPKEETIIINDKPVHVLGTSLPKTFAADELDAIFVDELNRGKRETLNGLLELIQMKSIRGYKLNRLKVVWSAINPYNAELDEEEQIYQVRPLDPALKDRYHIHIELPYVLNKNYLNKKYGLLAKPFMDWWEELDEGLQLICSPRNLEYAIMVFQKCAIIEDVLDKRLPIKNLVKKVNEFISSSERLLLKENILKSDVQSASKLISLENLPIVVDLLTSKEIPQKYIYSINQDFIEYYLTNFSKKNPLFINRLKEASNTNKDFLSANVEKILNVEGNDINFNLFTTKFTLGQISKHIIKIIFDHYREHQNILDLKFVMDGVISNLDNDFKHNLFTFHKKIMQTVSKNMKGNQNHEMDENQKKLNEISLNALIKQQLPNNDSNFVNILSGFLYYEIIKEIIKESYSSLNKDFTDERIDNMIVSCFGINKDYFFTQKIFTYVGICFKNEIFTTYEEHLKNFIVNAKTFSELQNSINSDIFVSEFYMSYFNK